VTPAAITCQALLNCLVREVSVPEQQAWESEGHLLVRLARVGHLLRVRLRRPSAGLGVRMTGDAQELRGGSWHAVGWQRLGRLIAAELTLSTGTANAEFGGQVHSSHAALTAILRARSVHAAPGTGGRECAGPQTGDLRIRRYLASEQALITGHRFHPAPKARQARDWLRYAPETGSAFPLQFLAVRDGLLAGDGDTAALDQLGAPAPPSGYRVLPVHPWQLRLLAGREWLRQARAEGLFIELGAGPREVVPTSSVRTVYDPAADVFCKFSLGVRITNCVRTSAWYELAAAVTLTRLLGPVSDELSARFPGTVLLGEPGYRTVALASRDAFEGLAVIVRDGLRGRLAPGVTPLLAASLTEPAMPGEEPGLLDGGDPGWMMAWWEAYLHRVVPPVLHAFFRHGIVLEPHLQNVLIGVDADRMPVQVIFRDLEGVKLLAQRHERLLATLAPRAGHALGCDAERGWNRVAYCLLVNHLAEIAAAIADRCSGQEAEAEAGLWRQARDVIAGFACDHDEPPQLRALLAGVPLPAKANLKVRWARAADHDATYVPLPNPLAGDVRAPDRDRTRTGSGRSAP
jgi:siderophore synthetase component